MPDRKDTETIQRWIVRPVDAYHTESEMSPRGDWVDYEAHAAALAEKDARITELEGAEADLRSLHGELARLFGPFNRKDATINEQALAGIAKDRTYHDAALAARDRDWEEARDELAKVWELAAGSLQGLQDPKLVGEGNGFEQAARALRSLSGSPGTSGLEQVLREKAARVVGGADSGLPPGVGVAGSRGSECPDPHCDLMRGDDEPRCEGDGRETRREVADVAAAGGRLRADREDNPGGTK